MSPETLRMVYFAYIHSIMSYCIIFWGNQPYSDKIFKIQKRVIRIVTRSRIPYIIVKGILIIRDIPLKIELTIGFRCFIIVLYL
jgi:hypothetical protein